MGYIFIIQQAVNFTVQNQLFWEHSSHTHKTVKMLDCFNPILAQIRSVWLKM